MQKGNLAAAERVFQQILNLDPDNANVLNLLGTIKLQQGWYGTAHTLIRRAMETAPSPMAPYFFNYGLVLEKINRADEAIETYRKAIALKEDLWSGWLNCCLLYLNLGRLAEAKAMAEAEAEAEAEDILRGYIERCHDGEAALYQKEPPPTNSSSVRTCRSVRKYAS